MKLNKTLSAGFVKISSIALLVFVMIMGLSYAGDFASAQPAPARCDNTIDDDGDGLIDDLDPGCKNKNDDDEYDPVTICHATGSHANPYNPSPADATADAGGHDGHDGPVWFSGIAVTWGDIIPPFQYDGGSYPGQNWTTEGEAIWNADCDVPTTAPATGSITIDKVTTGVGHNPDLDFAFTFNGSSTSPINFQLSSNDSAVTFTNLLVGSYSFSEVLPDNWSVLSVQCTGETESNSLTTNITLSEGELPVVCTVTNLYVAPTVPPATGGVIIEKTLLNDDETGTATSTDDFTFFVGGTPVQLGVATTFATGTYAVTEQGPSGYTQTFGGACDSQGNITVTANATTTCTITNDDVPSTDGTLTVTKVVVNDSGSGVSTTSDFTLQVVGANGTTTVTSGIAQAFPAGDYTVVESGPGGYTATFGTECANGAVTVVAGQAATCTLTNDDIPRDPQQCNVTVVSDETNTVNELGNAFAAALSFIHPAWTASTTGAVWIWGTDPVADATASTTQTFKKTFLWNGPVTSAVLDIASDNSYSVTLNGNPVGASSDENNFQAGTQDNYNVASEVVTGVNTLEVSVENWGLPASTAESNPAGLLYTLSVTGTTDVDCDNPPVTGDDDDDDDDDDTGDDDDDDDDDDGNGGGGGGRRRSSGDDDDDDGEVLGEQISIVPAGAPNTGVGGSKMCLF